jgi:hypothetical protein
VQSTNEYDDLFTDLNFDANFGNEIQVWEATCGKTVYEQGKNVEFSKNGMIRYIDE